MPKGLQHIYLSFKVSSSMKELSQATHFQRELTEDACVAAIAERLLLAAPGLKGKEEGMALYAYEAFTAHAGGAAPHFSIVVGYLGTPVGLKWLNDYSHQYLRNRFRFYRSTAEMEDVRRAELRARSKERRAKFIGGATKTRRTEGELVH